MACHSGATPAEAFDHGVSLSAGASPRRPRDSSPEGSGGRGQRLPQAARSRSANSRKVVAGRPVSRRTARLGKAEMLSRTTR